MSILLRQITVNILYFSSAPKFRKMLMYASKFSLDSESPLIVSSTEIVMSSEKELNRKDTSLSLDILMRFSPCDSRIGGHA